LLSNRLQAALALASNTLGDEFAGYAGDASVPVRPLPQLASLLAGAIPIDLANLQGAVDSFFARLEGLANDMTRSPETLRLIHWLLAGATTTGVFEFIRANIEASARPTPGDVDDDLWAPFPVLALVPPEDQP
jgi:hypothetical protein